ncbi:hypothetical protein ACFVTT_34130 [Streptomyces niveus]|uniref:hypothetical protein n=1 Tax=Streptomyces niveus TaxID=193462 RepID=UPI00342277D9
MTEKRLTVNDITSDQLDALYERLEYAAHVAADERDRAFKAERRADEAEEQRDGAYRERGHLVALVAGGLAEQAVIAPAPDVTEPGWQILYITLHDRQCSWHIAPKDAPLFEFLDHVTADDPRAQWDGHTTEAKYEHIAQLARALGTPGPFREEQPAGS